MNNLILSLTSALETVFVTANDIRTQLYTEANERKENLRRAIADMEEAADTLTNFSSKIFILSEKLENMAEDASISAEHIDDMLTDMNVYTATVEAFDGYCEECGSEILVTDGTFVNDEGLGVCINCYNREKEANVPVSAPIQPTILETMEEEA